MKKLAIVISIFFAFMLNTFVWAEGPVVTAPSAVLIDAKSGKVLYEKNAGTKMYPASTTKVMTGLLVAENGKMDDIVTVSDAVTNIERGSSQIYLIPGEQLSVEQLFYAMMLESANDAAIAIAEYISGNVTDFAKLMNKRAKELGATNTNFVNPNGLHKDNHYTTAKDLALIARQAMTLPKFREVVSTIHYSIPQTNKQEARDYITNGNKLIWKTMDQFRYEYATGIKTGYTVKSKHCLVSSAKKGDFELIAVIMGAEGTNMYSDSIGLFEYGFANFQSYELLQKNQIVTTVTVSDKNEKINLLAAESYSTLFSKDENDKLKSTISTNENIAPPIKTGDKLGSIIYTINDKEIKRIDLVAAQDVLPTTAQVAKKNWGKWLIWLLVIFLLYRTIITIFKEIKKKKRRRFTTYTKR